MRAVAATIRDTEMPDVWATNHLGDRRLTKDINPNPTILILPLKPNRNVTQVTSPQSNLRTSRRKGPIGTPQIHPQNCPFSFDDHHLHLIHPSFDRSLSPPQTASGSNQPFCHSSLLRTDRWDKRIFCTISAPLPMLIERDALKSKVLSEPYGPWRR